VDESEKKRDWLLYAVLVLCLVIIVITAVILLGPQPVLGPDNVPSL
jgi:hypothetical protein